MPIAAKINSSYLLSELVNQKYQPLQELVISERDRPDVERLIKNRAQTFAPMNLRNLVFSGEGIESVPATEKKAEQLPPIAIISSGRSTWIKDTYERGKGMLGEDETNFENEKDRTPLKAGPVPIYCPFRLSEDEQKARNVYIFVHKDEYEVYATNLKGTGIKVIGWNLGRTHQCLGFGGSRYAAMEFFKHLYKLDTKCSRVWLIDDNAIYIKSFPGFKAVEDVMSENPSFTGIGFSGGTKVESDPFFYAIGNDTKEEASAGALEAAPILQQAALWNVKNFYDDKINFSPFFFSSAEDSSLTKFLGAGKCKYYKACRIEKATIPPSGRDNKPGTLSLAAKKNKLARYIFNHRKALKINNETTTLETLLLTFSSTIRDKEPMAYMYSKAEELIIFTALASGSKLLDDWFKFPKPAKVKLINAVAL